MDVDKLMIEFEETVEMGMETLQLMFLSQAHKPFTKEENEKVRIVWTDTRELFWNLCNMWTWAAAGRVDETIFIGTMPHEKGLE